MPTIEKHLDVGKWRLQVSGEITAVRLKGMRNRSYNLVRTEKDDFHSRLMKNPKGEVTDPVILRGTPSMYFHEGPWLMLWPSPAHQWTVEIDVIKKEKVA